MRYEIHYSPEALDQLAELSAAQRSRVLDAIDRQLTHQPTARTRNRKPMRANRLAEWELRVGDTRVYYRVADEPSPLVTIVAVGVKTGNEVRISGKVVEL